MRRSVAAFALFFLAAQPALAQSSLGFRTGDVSIATISHSAKDGSVSSEVVRVRGDFAITGYHGAQFDLDYANAGSASIGTLAAHLYMTPRKGQKYGLFASIGDYDSISSTVAQLGAEGMFAVGDAYLLETRAGIGVRDPKSMDYIFAGLGLSRPAGRAGRLTLAVDVADLEETGFATSIVDGRITYEHFLQGTPASLSVTLGAVTLDGSGAGRGGAYVGLGLRIRLGRGGTDPATRLFDRTAPITMLHRIGVF